jgi:NADH-quinone oxidoreductase subunit M
MGPLNEKWKKLPDINLRELITVVPLVLLVLAVGVCPLLLLKLQDGGIQALLKMVGGS